MTTSPGGGVRRSPQGGLAEVLDLVLNKGLVIDVFMKVSLVGIEIVTIDARVVVASIDTCLRFAAATDRLDLHAKGGKGLADLPAHLTEKVGHGRTKGVLDAGQEKFQELREEHRERRDAKRRR